MEAGSGEASVSTRVALSQRVLPLVEPDVESIDGGSGRPHSSKQRHRTRRACYPCSKRKIKCDRDERVPCSNCAKRPNAELCTFDDDRPRSTRPRLSNTGTVSPTPASLTGDELGHERTPPRSLARSVQNVGTHYGMAEQDRRLMLQTNDPPRSIASLDHNPLVEPNPGVSLARYRLSSDSTSQMTGVQNGSAESSPFLAIHHPPPVSNGTHISLSDPSALAAPSSTGVTNEIKALLPPVKHVAKFGDLYQKTCQVLYPVDIGLPHVEELVFQYIHRAMADRLVMHLEGRNGPAFRAEVMNVALLCAGIAAGVQLSDMEDGERRPLIKHYAAAVMKLLRIADAQVGGVLSAYPVMLILARVVQDEQDPLLAYALLGTAARTACLYSISSVVPDRLHDDSGRLRSADHLVSVRRRQESFLAILLGQTHQLQRPAFPTLQNQHEATYLDGVDFFAAMAAFCGNEHIDREETLLQHLDALEAMRPFAYSVQPHLADKAHCRNQHELLQHCVLQIYASLVQMHFCQVIMAGCRYLPGHDDQYFQTGVLCQERARACVEAYLDLLGFSIVAPRSWTLTAATLRAALILGASLAERPHTIVEAQPDRERMTRLLSAFSTVHEAAQGDQARWLARYRPVFDKIRDMSEQSARADHSHPAGNGQGTLLHHMSREDRDEIMLPQRMARRYLATTVPDEATLTTLLLSQQSSWGI